MVRGFSHPCLKYHPPVPRPSSPLLQASSLTLTNPRPFAPSSLPPPRPRCRHQPEAALQLLTAAQEPSDDNSVAAGGPASAALHPSAVLLARARAALLHGRIGDTAGAMSELVKHKMRVASAFAAAGANGGGGGAGSATPNHVQLMTQASGREHLWCYNNGILWVMHTRVIAARSRL